MENNMTPIQLCTSDADRAAPLLADFRTALASYRGIVRVPDPDAAKAEFLDFAASGYPMYGVEYQGQLIGYLICRIEEPCLWVEQLYVQNEYRRMGAATLLFDKAEELSRAMGEETVFNFVHPNNEGVIRFLRSKGYTVLNMIEIRKPYRGEIPKTQIQVGQNLFDY